MAFTKLKLRINLSEIPEGVKRMFNDGTTHVYLDVAERKTPSPKGATHTVSVWSKETGKVYVGEGKEEEYGGSQPSAPQEKVQRDEPIGDDIPF